MQHNNQEIINCLAQGDIDSALLLSKDLPEIQQKILKSVEFLSSPTEYKKVYSSDLKDIDERKPGLFIDGEPDSRQSKIVEHVSLLENKWRLLDVGCADGSLIAYLFRRQLIKYGHGVDAWESGVAFARNYAKIKGMNAEFTCCLAEEFNDFNAYDVVVMREILEHVINPEILFRRAHRLLGPDRHLIITVPIDRPPVTDQEAEFLLSGKPNLHVRLFDIDKIYQLSKMAGFEFRRLEIEGRNWKNLVITMQKL